MKKKKIVAGVVIVALLCSGGWWYISRRAAARASANAVRHIEEPVRRGDVRIQVSGSGPVTSVNGVTVTANQSGTIEQILAQDGDRVEAGQAIIQLGNPSLVASLAQARLDLQSARTNLENLIHPQATAVRAQELKVESARVTLQQRQEDVANLAVKAPSAGVIASVDGVVGGSINAGALLFTLYDESSPTLILSLSQEVASVLSAGQRATVTLAGLGTLEGVVGRLGGSATPASGNRDATIPVAIDLPPTPGIRPGMVGQVTVAVPGLTYRVQGSGAVENDALDVRAKVAGTIEQIAVAEGDRVAADQPLLTIANESLRLQLAQAENDLATQEQALASLIDPAQDPDSQLPTYQQKVEQAKLTLSQRETDVADLAVKAPVSGTLSGLTAVVGDKVNANASLFRVADYTRMEVTISVDELDIAQIKPGQPATIILDALPDKTYRGQVTKVNPEGTFRNDIATFEVTVAIDQAEGLMAGMNATVDITVVERADVLSVPVSAVQTIRGKSFVSVLENEQVVPKPVEVGVKSNDRYEIIGGLSEGEMVITTTIRSQSGSSFGSFPMGGRGGFGGGGPAGGSRPAGGGGPIDGGGGPVGGGR